MANDFAMALEDLLRKSGTEGADFLQEGVQLLTQELNGAGGKLASGRRAVRAER